MDMILIMVTTVLIVALVATMFIMICRVLLIVAMLSLAFMVSWNSVSRSRGGRFVAVTGCTVVVQSVGSNMSCEPGLMAVSASSDRRLVLG